MDKTRAAVIRRTQQHIAILNTVITTKLRKGGDASEEIARLAAEERYLASGCAPPREPEPHTRTEGTAVGYIPPPSAK
jgi:hypothetical protein